MAVGRNQAVYNKGKERSLSDDAIRLSIIHIAEHDVSSEVA